MTHHRPAHWLLILACALILAPSVALGAPATLGVEGVLTSTGGAPAADGKYDVTFAIYADANAKSPLWQEGPMEIAVFGGRFATTLGKTKALDAKVLAPLATPMLGLTVGKEPELPRRPLQATAYALHAAVAQSAMTASALSCTGCVATKALKFDGDIDLAGNSLKAKNGTFTGDLVANTVTATGFAGDGSKLTGLPVPKGDCKTGTVVIGVAADGSLKCGPALAGDALPKDGIAGVSNGLLTNQFTDTLGAQALPVAIPDNTGSEALAKVLVPDLGTAQSLDVRVKLGNTDLSTVRLVLLPPDDKKTGVTLCDPCGAKDAKTLDGAWPSKAKPKSGDLGKWVGKNPKGEWLLKALDSSFCVVQAPGNAAYCDPAKKQDGTIAGFDVVVKTLSNEKVGATGLIQLALMAKPPVGCIARYKGSLFYDTTADGVRYCDGKDWRLLADTCGNGILELAEECDDGNNIGGDGCSATCRSGRGLTKDDAGRTCKAILAAAPTSKSALYWLDLDGPGAGAAAQYQCDMSAHGGGWTRVYVESPLTTSGWSSTTSTTATIGGAKSGVHGPYGQGSGTTKTVSLGGAPHSAVRVSGRFFAIDSWDGEAARVYLDSTLVFNRTKVYSSAGGSGWTTVGFSPAPWTGSSVDGYWDLWSQAGQRVHTAATVKVQLTSTLDQDKSDESWVADNIAVWVR